MSRQTSSDTHHSQVSNAASHHDPDMVPTHQPINNITSLRILPLGDSITYGFGSTDGNGYRLDLLSMLTSDGTQVHYIGSQRAGNMKNNHNEGHGGAVITQIADFTKRTLLERPNLILLMAGTNDMNIPIDPDKAPQRLGSLIDMCHAVCPDATLVVAQLTPAVDATSGGRIKRFNGAIPGIVEERVGNGMKALTVDMCAYVSLADLADGLHPNDNGYNQMALAWLDGIQEAASKGWITPPIAVEEINNEL